MKKKNKKSCNQKCQEDIRIAVNTMEVTGGDAVAVACPLLKL